MFVQFTCQKCSSSIEVIPNEKTNWIKCDVCAHEEKVCFSKEHENGIIHDCPNSSCANKYFYKQRDFNRKIGVLLFVFAAILSIYTYGISFIVLYAFDFFLFKKLKTVVICYQCGTNFRGVHNLNEIADFDHEKNDRIVYQ